VLVGAFSLVSYAAGFGALAVILLACASLVLLRTTPQGPDWS
jgi:hypothetical protein